MIIFLIISAKLQLLFSRKLENHNIKQLIEINELNYNYYNCVLLLQLVPDYRVI